MGANSQILSQLKAAFSNLSLGKKITLATLILGSMLLLRIEIYACSKQVTGFIQSEIIL